MVLGNKDIKIVELIVKRFKPVVEKISGLSLEDIVVISAIDSLERFVGYQPNKIIINEYRDYAALFYPNLIRTLFCRSKEKLELSIMHELGHHVAYTFNPKGFLDDGIESNIIQEGFAEYFSLELVPKGILYEKIVQSRKNWLNWLSGKEEYFGFLKSDYIVGYRFFTKIGRELGKEEAVTIIKNMNISLNELKNPELYINRRQNGNIQEK